MNQYGSRKWYDVIETGFPHHLKQDQSSCLILGSCCWAQESQRARAGEPRVVHERQGCWVIPTRASDPEKGLRTPRSQPGFWEAHLGGADYVHLKFYQILTGPKGSQLVVSSRARGHFLPTWESLRRPQSKWYIVVISH